MTKVLFIGCGNMGTAIAKAMRSSDYFRDAHIEAVIPSNSQHLEQIRNELKLQIYIDTPPQQLDIDLVIFAVKPQTLPEIMPIYQKSLPSSALLLSIAAGKTISFFEHYFPNHAIIRTMPNINLQVGYGATAGFANNKCTDEHKILAEKIFASVGVFEWLEREDLINQIIAVSGSSPAYFLQFLEYLVECGIEQGLSSETSYNMALEAFIGTAHTLEKTKIAPSELRKMITSHKGTTQAALDALNEDDALKALISKACNAAIKRSQELSDN